MSGHRKRPRRSATVRLRQVPAAVPHTASAPGYPPCRHSRHTRTADILARQDGGPRRDPASRCERPTATSMGGLSISMNSTIADRRFGPASGASRRYVSIPAIRIAAGCQASRLRDNYFFPVKIIVGDTDDRLAIGSSQARVDPLKDFRKHDVRQGRDHHAHQPQVQRGQRSRNAVGHIAQCAHQSPSPSLASLRSPAPDCA